MLIFLPCSASGCCNASDPHSVIPLTRCAHSTLKYVKPEALIINKCNVIYNRSVTNQILRSMGC
ncbi:hypothetical protein BDF20DRAFT_871228 [Mycotypha africana]|uniref:uncharacterized protein n=1 Tax=Mycotypha africana TaxID=64632 RepID=UPI00230161E0|nr:uncharacterized protein BDF20DRAFT_871228 [Mycotypha africana]KAI8979712.1 hypothetical protein BDF20DRAFT_871228 [Mycotypha africana]